MLEIFKVTITVKLDGSKLLGHKGSGQSADGVQKPAAVVKPTAVIKPKGGSAK